MKRTFGILLFCFIGFLTQGQRRFLNGNYFIEPRSEYTLAIAPFTGTHGELINQSLQTLFRKPWRQLRVVPQSEVKNAIAHDAQIESLFDMIRRRNYSNYEMKSFPGLNTLIGESSVGYLSEALGGAQLLLIPTSLRLYSGTDTTTSKAATGAVDIRLYDLTTGQLIMIYREESNVMGSGEAGMKKLADSLCAAFFQYFSKSFVEAQEID